MFRLTMVSLVAIAILDAVWAKPAHAGASVDVHLVVRETATPEGQAVTTTLPNSILTLPVGMSYVVEIWMQDTWDASMPGGPSNGLTGGEFDLHFDTNLSDATSLHYEGPFLDDRRFHTGTIIEESGWISDFSNATVLPNIGVAPNYARLGYIAFSATGAGTQQLTLDEGRTARIGLGWVDPGDVHVGSASLVLVPLDLGSFSMLSTAALGLLAHPWRRRGRR